MGFFKFILIIILIYYLIKLFTRFLLPIILRNYITKKMGNMDPEQASQRSEDDIRINETDFIHKGKKSTDTEDEFTDYEEIE